MPGIFGFTKKNQSANIETVQKSMMLYSHFKKDDLFEDELIAASRVHLNKIGEKNSPIHNDGVFAWVEGEFYNHTELAVDFGYEESSSFGECLIFVYQQNLLDSFLNKLDGYFCAAIYDKNNNDIKLISDRYGMRMLYWYLNGGQFAWSSEVKGILALNGIDKSIDKASFKCFMELGHLLGTNTWFEKIKLIEPASVVSVNLSNNSFEHHYYWSWEEIKASSISFDDAVDELGHRFIRAVERRFDPNEKIGITLSGGLDSRVILAAIDHLYPGYKGYAFTFGVEGCDDIALAKQVVQRSNWEHKEYHFTDDNWFQLRIEKVWNTDGMKDMKHMHGGEFIDDIAGCIDVNLNGYLGDAIFGGSYLKSKEHLNRRINQNIAKSYYKDHVNKNDFESDFFNIEHIEPFLFMARGRRFINLGTVNSLVSLEQRKPFFDNQCVEFVYSLPDEYRANNKLYSAMLHKFFPKFFKDIPWQQTGKPAGVLADRTFLLKAVTKLGRIIKSFFGIEDKKSFTDYQAWILSPDVHRYLTELLEADKAYYKELTSTDFAKQYLKKHNKHFDNSNEVLRVATVELYLRALNKASKPELL